MEKECVTTRKGWTRKGAVEIQPCPPGIPIPKAKHFPAC